MNPKVDAYISRAKNWQEETSALRAILLGCKLDEELKWGQPCYVYQGGNIAIIQGFKNACTLMFLKGALLKDPKGILRKVGENSQATRRIEFTSAQQIAKLEPALKAYIREAIEIEKAGLKVEFKKNPEPVPEELQEKFKQDTAFKKAFESLTPGRQRAYILHFSVAKQSSTRVSRIEKCIPRILDGKGLDDR